MSYFTIDRDHRDRISKELGEHAGQSLLVWMALCDVANTRGPEFEIKQAALARLACVSVRTLQRALENLEELKLVVRKATKNGVGGNGECTYELPPMRPRVVGPTTQSQGAYDSTPTTASRSVIIGNTYKRGENPNATVTGTLPTHERISLEKEAEVLPERIASLTDRIKYEKNPEAQDQIRAQVKQARERLAEIRATVGGRNE